MLRRVKEGKIRKAIKKKAENRDYKVLKGMMEKMPVLRKLVTHLLKPEVLLPKQFYNRLMKDIIEAEGEIIIYSPFTLYPKVKEILAFIKRCEASVTVYTKPEDEFKGQRKTYQRTNIKELEKAGVKVETKERMHEKAVLIGDKIAYFGSLNVLSRWKEEEGGDYMLRYESPLVAPLIEEFIREIGSE